MCILTALLPLVGSLQHLSYDQANEGPTGPSRTQYQQIFWPKSELFKPYYPTILTKKISYQRYSEVRSAKKYWWLLASC